MPSQEESRESAHERFMVVGWVLVAFALLVLFFEPAVDSNSDRKWIPGIAAVLFVVGLLLNIYGYRLWTAQFLKF